eukprot:768221-Hanusia_phi.AAC.19
MVSTAHSFLLAPLLPSLPAIPPPPLRRPNALFTGGHGHSEAGVPWPQFKVGSKILSKRG